MKNKVMIILCAMIAVVCLSSCYHYWPVNCDIPLMEEKGDCRIDAAVTGVGVNVAATYSPVNHLALQADVSTLLYIPYHFRQGVGCYTHLGSGVGEVYVGYSMEMARLSTEYLQLNYGWNGLWNGKMDIGLGVRGSLFDWYCHGESDADPGTYYGERFSTQLIEPQAMIRLGGEHLKFSMNVVYSLWLSDENPYDWPFNVSLGVNYRF
ncbi:MAG: hypothetical protein K5864_04355 [Bacteroidales bacterium]|nr:hypothetical protein [Bacteroidales bacterium]